jgi:hypothetical protein
MKKYLILLLATLLIVSCGPATPVPLSKIQLDTIIVQEGDLPAGFSGAEIRDTVPSIFSGLPATQKAAYQQLKHNGNLAGGITIFLYDSQEDIDSTYDLLAGDMGENATPSSEVGEKATTLSTSVEVQAVTTEMVEVTFARCSAVVHIRMMETHDVNAVITYAKALDTRLEALVCR